MDSLNVNALRVAGLWAALFAHCVYLSCGDSGTRSDCEPLDESLVVPSPDQFQQVADCVFKTFDLRAAVDAESQITIVWLVAYRAGAGDAPDAVNSLHFTLNPCLDPRAAPNSIITVEALVIPGAVSLANLSTADSSKSYAASREDSGRVIWFVGLDGNECCL